MFLFIIQSGGFRKQTIFHDYYYVNGMDLITFGKVISFLGENFSFVIIHITNKISDIRARNQSQCPNKNDFHYGSEFKSCLEAMPLFLNRAEIPPRRRKINDPSQ